MKVLMVCLGNICRSPMAEGVLRHLARERGVELTVDSAGTANYHVGDPPDHRARATMSRFGINIDHLRGRQVETADFRRFDLLLPMDGSNEADLLDIAPDEKAAARVRRMMVFAPDRGDEVPDPYYGPDSGFDEVYHMLKDACNGLLDEIAGRK